MYFYLLIVGGYDLLWHEYMDNEKCIQICSINLIARTQLEYRGIASGMLKPWRGNLMVIAATWSSFFFTFMWPCIVTNFFIIKPTRCINFPNLLQHETLHVLSSSSAHHQEFIHCTLSTGICHTDLRTAFEQDQDGTCFILFLYWYVSFACLALANFTFKPVPSWSCSKAVFKPVWHIPVPSVQWINSWWWAEELPEICRVSCRSTVFPGP